MTADRREAGASASTGAAPAPPLAWWHGGGPLLVLPAVVLLYAPPAWPRWALMWALAFALYSGCKWLTWRRTPSGAPPWRQAAYLLAWPGLDAAAFLQGSTPPRPTVGEWLFAAAKLSLGLALLAGGVRLLPADQPYLVGWAGMVGIVLVLHFGVFHLLSCFWRRLGIEARPLMHWPSAAVSLGAFWGQRWNTAFRDLTHRYLFRPLTARLGPRRAVLGGFVFSGLVHELVISVPASGGYGGPTIFFALQGAGLLAERSRLGRRLGLGHGLPGWLFTLAVLLLPAGLLFHRPFVGNIVVPFLQALGAVP